MAWLNQLCSLHTCSTSGQPSTICKGSSASALQIGHIFTSTICCLVRLSIVGNLTRRHIVDVNMCPVCKSEAKYPLHMVLDCLEVEQVWREHGWFNQAISSPLIVFTDLLSRFLLVTKDNRAELFICMAWSLWQWRNKLRIGLPSLPLNLVGPQAAKFLQDYLNAQANQPISTPTATSTLSWCPLSSQPFKANFDGAVFNNSHSASVGVIIRDKNGEVIAAMSQCIPFPNSA